MRLPQARKKKPGMRLCSSSGRDYSLSRQLSGGCHDQTCARRPALHRQPQSVPLRGLAKAHGTAVAALFPNLRATKGCSLPQRHGKEGRRQPESNPLPVCWQRSRPICPPSAPRGSTPAYRQRLPNGAPERGFSGTGRPKWDSLRSSSTALSCFPNHLGFSDSAIIERNHPADGTAEYAVHTLPLIKAEVFKNNVPAAFAIG